MKSQVRTEVRRSKPMPRSSFGPFATSASLLAVLASLAGLASLSIGACRPSSDALDPQSLPENVRADYQVFARRCSKCHSLARPLTAGITDQGQWESYVARMRMQPASGITADDQVVILRFLKFYSDEERRKKSEKNGANQAPAGSLPSSTGSPMPTPVSPMPPAPNPPAIAPTSAPAGAR